LDKSFAPRSQEIKFELTAPHYFNLLFMLLVQPLSTGRVFPFPCPTQKVSTLFKNDL
jgi:hypothetical protein